MTSEDDKRKQELEAKLFIPDHCPSIWDWQKFCVLGETLYFSKGNKSVVFGWDSYHRGLTENPGCVQLEFIQQDKFMSHECECNHFTRIRMFDPNDCLQFTGFFDPHKRRASFFLGNQPEPAGLLLFFIWYARFNQQIDKLIDFLHLFIFSPKNLPFASLDFDSFLEIRDVVGENKKEDLQKATEIAKQLVEEFKKDCKKHIELYCPSQQSHHLRVFKATREIFDMIDIVWFRIKVDEARTLSVAIKAILDFILETREAIGKASEIL
ncbi:MAG: hypothetical protein WCT16_03530 [Candidatus Buchananbacteria bacterium]